MKARHIAGFAATTNQLGMDLEAAGVMAPPSAPGAAGQAAYRAARRRA